MNGVAGRRLKHLGEQAVGITGKVVAKRLGLLLCIFERGDLQPEERTAKLNDDAGIGRQVAKANNTANRAFAADEDGLYVASLFVRDKKRCQAWPAREIDRLDVIPRVVKQFIGAAF